MKEYFVAHTPKILSLVVIAVILGALIIRRIDSANFANAPIGILKPISYLTSDLALTDSELPAGWYFSKQFHNGDYGYGTSNYMYSDSSDPNKPWIDIIEQFGIYESVITATHLYDAWLDANFPPKAADQWFPAPDLSIEPHADQFKIACLPIKH